MRDCSIIGPDYFNTLGLWAKKNTVPLTVVFELTPLCNFNCVMCYVHLSKEQAQSQGKMLSAEQWLDIARQAKEMGTLNLTLTGGEPFLHPEFWEIYSNLNQMGFLISILSNGSLIDEQTMENFRRFGMPYSMKLTLYGTSNETYKKVCGVNDGFTKVSKAISLIQREKIPLKLSATIVRPNACDLQDIYKFARERSIPIEHTTSVLKSARGATNTVEESRFSLDEFKHEMTLESLEKSKFPAHQSPFALCGGHRSSLWITWHGHIQQCSFMSVPFVQYSGILSQDHKALTKEIENIKNPPECEDCRYSEFCQRCPGILCAESGHPEKTDQRLCNIAKNLYEIHKSLKEG